MSHSPNCPSRPSKFKRSPTRVPSTRERIIPRELPDSRRVPETDSRPDKPPAAPMNRVHRPRHRRTASW